MNWDGYYILGLIWGVVCLLREIGRGRGRLSRKERRRKEEQFRDAQIAAAELLKTKMGNKVKESVRARVKGNARRNVMCRLRQALRICNPCQHT
jgi:hypothetical protein